MVSTLTCPYVVDEEILWDEEILLVPVISEVLVVLEAVVIPKRPGQVPTPGVLLTLPSKGVGD